MPLYLISFSKELEVAPSFQLCEYFFQKNKTPFLKCIRAFSPVGEMNNSCCSKSTMTDSNFFFLKKKDPAISLTHIYPKELKVGSQKDTCTLVFTAGLFTIGKRWKQLKCPPVDECINKMWYVQIREYYSAFKRKETLSHATSWLNLEDIMLSEVSQSQEDKYCMIPLIWDTQSSQTHRNKVEWWLSGAGGREKGELVDGYSISDL